MAERFLARHGYTAAHYEDETAARDNVARDAASKRWPLMLTPLDTSGEKPYEEFVGEGEKTLEIGLPNLLAVGYRPAAKGSVGRLIERIADYFQPARNGSALPQADKDVLKAFIADVEPSFLENHRETGRNLDQRM